MTNNLNTLKTETMHYKNGRKANVGDSVIGMTYNKPGVQVGVVKSITPDAKTCNVVLDLPTIRFGRPETEYTQCDYLLHAEDAYHFVIGVAYSPNGQDYMAKILNFNKWNAPTPELPASYRPAHHGVCKEFAEGLEKRLCSDCTALMEYHAVQMSEEGVIERDAYWCCPSCSKNEPTDRPNND